MYKALDHVQKCCSLRPSLAEMDPTIADADDICHDVISGELMEDMTVLGVTPPFARWEEWVSMNDAFTITSGDGEVIDDIFEEDHSSVTSETLQDGNTSGQIIDDLGIHGSPIRTANIKFTKGSNKKQTHGTVSDNLNINKKTRDDPFYMGDVTETDLEGLCTPWSVTETMENFHNEIYSIHTEANVNGVGELNILGHIDDNVNLNQLQTTVNKIANFRYQMNITNKLFITNLISTLSKCFTATVSATEELSKMIEMYSANNKCIPPWLTHLFAQLISRSEQQVISSVSLLNIMASASNHLMHLTFPPCDEHGSNIESSVKMASPTIAEKSPANKSSLLQIQQFILDKQFSRPNSPNVSSPERSAHTSDDGKSPTPAKLSPRNESSLNARLLLDRTQDMFTNKHTNEVLLDDSEAIVSLLTGKVYPALTSTPMISAKDNCKFVTKKSIQSEVQNNKCVRQQQTKVTDVMDIQNSQELEVQGDISRGDKAPPRNKDKQDFTRDTVNMSKENFFMSNKPIPQSQTTKRESPCQSSSQITEKNGKNSAPANHKEQSKLLSMLTKPDKKDSSKHASTSRQNGSRLGEGDKTSLKHNQKPRYDSRNSHHYSKRDGYRPILPKPHQEYSNKTSSNRDSSHVKESHNKSNSGNQSRDYCDSSRNHKYRTHGNHRDSARDCHKENISFERRSHRSDDEHDDSRSGRNSSSSYRHQRLNSNKTQQDRHSRQGASRSAARSSSSPDVSRTSRNKQRDDIGIKPKAIAEACDKIREILSTVRVVKKRKTNTEDNSPPEPTSNEHIAKTVAPKAGPSKETEVTEQGDTPCFSSEFEIKIERDEPDWNYTPDLGNEGANLDYNATIVPKSEPFTCPYESNSCPAFTIQETVSMPINTVPHNYHTGDKSREGVLTLKQETDETEPGIYPTITESNIVPAITDVRSVKNEKKQACLGEKSTHNDYSGLQEALGLNIKSVSEVVLNTGLSSDITQEHLTTENALSTNLLTSSARIIGEVKRVFSEKLNTPRNSKSPDRNHTGASCVKNKTATDDELGAQDIFVELMANFREDLSSGSSGSELPDMDYIRKPPRRELDPVFSASNPDVLSDNTNLIDNVFRQQNSVNTIIHKSKAVISESDHSITSDDVNLLDEVNKQQNYLEDIMNKSKTVQAKDITPKTDNVKTLGNKTRVTAGINKIRRLTKLKENVTDSTEDSRKQVIPEKQNENKVANDKPRCSKSSENLENHKHSSSDGLKVDKKNLSERSNFKDLREKLTNSKSKENLLERKSSYTDLREKLRSSKSDDIAFNKTYVGDLREKLRGSNSRENDLPDLVPTPTIGGVSQSMDTANKSEKINWKELREKLKGFKLTEYYQVKPNNEVHNKFKDSKSKECEKSGSLKSTQNSSAKLVNKDECTKTEGLDAKENSQVRIKGKDQHDELTSSKSQESVTSKATYEQPGCSNLKRKENLSWSVSPTLTGGDVVEDEPSMARHWFARKKGWHAFGKYNTSKHGNKRKHKSKQEKVKDEGTHDSSDDKRKRLPSTSPTERPDNKRHRKTDRRDSDEKTTQGNKDDSCQNATDTPYIKTRDDNQHSKCASPSVNRNVHTQHGSKDRTKARNDSSSQEHRKPHSQKTTHNPSSDKHAQQSTKDKTDKHSHTKKPTYRTPEHKAETSRHSRTHGQPDVKERTRVKVGNDAESWDEEYTEYIGPMKTRGFQYKEECMMITDEVYNHPFSDAFRHEIKVDEIADYYKLVKYPICLDMVASKLRRGYYETLRQYVSDMRRIFWNSRLYNKKGKVHLPHTKMVEKICEQKIREVFPDDDFSDISGSPQFTKRSVRQVSSGKKRTRTYSIPTELRNLLG